MMKTIVLSTVTAILAGIVLFFLLDYNSRLSKLEGQFEIFSQFQKSAQKRLDTIPQIYPKCVEGPAYSNGYVTLRVTPVLPPCWFVAVSQNSPDAVWVQRLDRPDRDGRLHLEAYDFKGRYAVYAACDEGTINSFRDLQAQAANGNAATVHDLPTGALQICVSDSK